MGRPPIGKTAMTGAERVRRWRAANAAARPELTEAYAERLARPPAATTKLIMGLIGNLDPDQRDTLFAKLKRKYEL